MNLKSLHNLRRALEREPRRHLSDDLLAEMTSAELAGEDLAQAYPLETAHLESCLPCAEAYAELMEMALAAFDEMAAAAANVPPLEAYAALLQAALPPQARASADLPEAARRLAGGLPTLFTQPPAAPEDIRPETIAAAAPTLSSDLLHAFTHAIRQNLAALSLYLRGAAGSAWGRAVQAASGTAGGWGTLRLQPAPLLVQPILGEAESTEDEWELASVRVGQPIPINVTLRAERLAPLACRVVVRADRPGLATPTGRAVELHFAGATLTAHTDAGGVARFEPVPIPALPHLEIRLKL